MTCASHPHHPYGDIAPLTRGFLFCVIYVFIMYSVLCIDNVYDTVSVTEHPSLDDARTDAERIHREFTDVRVEIHDDIGCVYEYHPR